MATKEIDFELPVEDGKYTVRVFKGGGLDALRYGEPWIDSFTGIQGCKMFISMIFELHELREKLERAEQCVEFATRDGDSRLDA